MKLYLASRFTNIKQVREYADQLKSDGHEITANWVYGGEEGLTFTDIAVLDVKDVIRADALILFTEPYGTPVPGGGRMVEFGVALATNKRLFIVGDRENVFHWWPNITQFPRFEHLRNHLTRWIQKDTVSTTTSETSDSSQSNSQKTLPLPTVSLVSAEKQEKSQKKPKSGTETVAA